MSHPSTPSTPSHPSTPPSLSREDVLARLLSLDQRLAALTAGVGQLPQQEEDEFTSSSYEEDFGPEAVEVAQASQVVTIFAVNSPPPVEEIYTSSDEEEEKEDAVVPESNPQQPTGKRTNDGIGPVAKRPR
jgi:hypothetical protein